MLSLSPKWRKSFRWENTGFRPYTFRDLIFFRKTRDPNFGILHGGDAKTRFTKIDRLLGIRRAYLNYVP